MLGVSDRQAHLSAMGVQQWYSRTKLAGALSTPEWALHVPVNAGLEVLPTEVGPASPSAVEESVAKSGAVQAKSAMDILRSGGLRESDDGDRLAINPTPVNEKASPSAVAGNRDLSVEVLPKLPGERALESFALVLYRTRHGLVISESVDGRSHPSEFQLLSNMLSAKKVLKARHGDSQFHQVFTWPVFRSLNLQSKQEDELPKLLSDWLLSNCTDSVQEVVYMGSSFSALRQFYSELLVSVNKPIGFASLNYSLADMIRFPQRKAEVWSELCAQFGG